MSGDTAERIALDVHAHLAPVLNDRLGGIAGVEWDDAAGALTIDGYTLAAKSVYRPEALIAWMDEQRVERAWISIPPPLYRLALEPAAMRTWVLYVNDGLDALAAATRDAFDVEDRDRHTTYCSEPSSGILFIDDERNSWAGFSEGTMEYMPEKSIPTNEPRWPAVLALLSIGGLYYALPSELTVGPDWLALALVAALAIPATILIIAETGA